MLGKSIGTKEKKKKMTVKESHEILINDESDKLIEQDKIIKAAKISTENNGIVFLDEIDKISGRTDRVGGDVSREGVQRDLLPLIEGTTVSTKYGPIKTDHILFIASGAFQLAKPSDLLPELQGRLPIRVELEALTSEDFKRILKEPDYSLIKQYVALLKTENVDLEFAEDGIDTIANIASEVNSTVENIGARRLHTIIEKILDEISFTATDRAGEKIIKNLRFRSSQTIISFISTINLSDLRKMIKVKADLVRAIPLPPISLKKGPVPICPPNRKVKNFFNKIGSTIEIKNEKLSINFWSTSGMMASYYEILNVMSTWLIKKGIKRSDAQKYITTLFLALSEDAVVNSKKDLRHLVKESQTPKGLNEQGVKELTGVGFYKSLEKTLNSIHRRLNK